MNQTALDNEIRAEYTSLVSAAMAQAGEDTMVIASNKIAFSVVDREGHERWVTVTITVPKDAEFDGYTAAEFYAESVKEKAEKRAEAERKKAEKIKKDAERRAEKAQANA